MAMESRTTKRKTVKDDGMSMRKRQMRLGTVLACVSCGRAAGPKSSDFHPEFFNLISARQTIGSEVSGMRLLGAASADANS
jgi:hypothetical protein